MSNDQEVFLTHKRLADMHRGGEKTVSEAVRNHKATWGVDDDTLRILKTRGVKWIGVKARDTGSKWLTHISRFFDDEIVQKKLVQRGRMIERHLPLDAFRHRSSLKKI
ncbi:MAG: hypothetical protein JJ979_03555 [Roseibium sp.]|nr:hypothetical protein [Roseibium sp.]